MNDQALLRYSRHILLDEIGIAGQEKINHARVLIIGAGGLSSPAALYLGAAGVGQITLIDPDEVDLTNLQRQILHTTDSLGLAKVHSGAQALARINPEVRVTALKARAEGALLAELVQEAEVVLDCSDNFTTRHAVNRACVAARTPLVSGAALRFDGQVSVFDARIPGAPCYNCLFDQSQTFEETHCALMGVFSPLVGIIGATQAAEALKLIVGCGTALTGRLLLLDALSMRWDSLHINADPLCAVCGAESRDLAGKTSAPDPV